MRGSKTIITIKITLRMIVTALILCGIFSCENKHNCNGELDGFWQMTEWRDNSDGKTVATKENGIFYAVSLNVLKTSRPQSGKYFLSTFRQTSDSIILTQSFESPFDSIVPFSKLEPYGVTDDGKFSIARLNPKELILKNKKNTLTFRKY